MAATISTFTFTLAFLFTEALPLIYESKGFSDASAMLFFLAIGIGLIFRWLTRIKDRHTMAKYERRGSPLEPEHKLIGFSIGAPMLAIGLWWFAWTIPPQVPGLEFDTILSGYLADSYLSYAGNGFIAMSSVQSIMSTAFPLFTRYMFKGLGSNVAATVFAEVATVFCVVPLLFTRYGHRIRARSKFAKYSLQY